MLSPGELIPMKSGFMLKLKDEQFNADIEIQVNKVIELKNTQLIYTYALMDRRFLKLALLLKKWNQKKFPDHKTRLNSYSIVLMLIAFL